MPMALPGLRPPLAATPSAFLRAVSFRSYSRNVVQATPQRVESVPRDEGNHAQGAGRTCRQSQKWLDWVGA